MKSKTPKDKNSDKILNGDDILLEDHSIVHEYDTKNKFHNRKINILGTEYTIRIRSSKNDASLKAEYDICGYCSSNTKEIVIRDLASHYADRRTVRWYYNFVAGTIRHEITHAYLCESGLNGETSRSESWAVNEEMIDWMAYQIPKVAKTFMELDIMSPK